MNPYKMGNVERMPDGFPLMHGKVQKIIKCTLFVHQTLKKRSMLIQFVIHIKKLVFNKHTFVCS